MWGRELSKFNTTFGCLFSENRAKKNWVRMC